MASRNASMVSVAPRPACSAAASSTFSARLASPSDSTASHRSASSSAVSDSAPSPRSASDRVRRRTTMMSSGLNGSSTTTRARDRSAPFNSNDGFSVVAPISVTVPDSTAGRNASCCARLNRWISSTNRIVPRPISRRRAASPMISRTRGTPSVTAENGTNSRSVNCATRWPNVVLPLPGGPHRMSEPTVPRSIDSRNGFPGPSTAACPTNSSSVFGRMRAASGALASGALNSDPVDRSRRAGIVRSAARGRA